MANKSELAELPLDGSSLELQHRRDVVLPRFVYVAVFAVPPSALRQMLSTAWALATSLSAAASKCQTPFTQLPLLSIQCIPYGNFEL